MVWREIGEDLHRLQYTVRQIEDLEERLCFVARKSLPLFLPTVFLSCFGIIFKVFFLFQLRDTVREQEIEVLESTSKER